MRTQTPTVRSPDPGAALILGGVLGLLLASGAAVAVCSWQVWQATTDSATNANASTSLAPLTGTPLAPSQPYPSGLTPEAALGYDPYMGENSGDGIFSPMHQPAASYPAAPAAPAPTNTSDSTTPPSDTTDSDEDK